MLFHTIPVRRLRSRTLPGNNGYSEHWVSRALHPKHSDAELSEYERFGEVAYMDHKMQQAKDYIRSHPAWFAWMTFRRIVYMWTGYWYFDAAYFERRAARSAQRFRQHDPVLASGVCAASGNVIGRWRYDLHRSFLFPADLLLLASRDVLLSSRRSAHRGSRGGGRDGAPEAEC
jgi:hypothetical protein